MALAQGKYAEGRVREFLKRLKADRASFTYNRILDAHSAKGAMSNPQAGDFQWFEREDEAVLVARKDRQATVHYLTRNGLIEVKEVKHTNRLPYKNFSPDQVGRMRIRQMAGSKCLVLVCFRPEGHNPYWRSAPLDYFEQRDPARPSGSWDMDALDAYTACDDILQEYFK